MRKFKWSLNTASLLIAAVMLIPGCSKDIPMGQIEADTSLESARVVAAFAYYAANAENDINDCGCYDVFDGINFEQATGANLHEQMNAIRAGLTAAEEAHLFDPVCTDGDFVRSACAANCEDRVTTDCGSISLEEYCFEGLTSTNGAWGYPLELSMRNGDIVVIENPIVLFEVLADFYRHNNNDCENEIDLCGSQEVPPVDSEGEGEFEYELKNDGRLKYKLKANNLSSDVLFAHIHVAPCGENGPVGATLFNPDSPVTANGGTLIVGFLGDEDLSGPWEGLTTADVCDALDAGEAYINVHTVDVPSGELRGQIGEEECTCDDDNDDEEEECENDIDLCGEQEVPPVDSDGEGEFEYELEDDGTLKYKLKASGLSSDVLFAHIHVAPCGENGPVGVTLFNPDSPVPANGELIEGELTDADLSGPWEGLTTADVCAALEAGEAYINVHTIDVPSGELRGQLGEEDCTCEDNDDDDDDDEEEDCEDDVDLCDASEVPPVESNGYGKFDYRLKNDGSMWYKLRVMHLNSDVLFAHIHLAPCGVNGPVVATIYNPDTPDRSNGTLIVSTLTDEDLSGLWEGLTIEDVCAAFEAGEAYVNVHTIDIPSGELRGQIGDEECECED